ncbi:MAG: PaaI family thioesterase [Deferribacterales bacterium]
MGVRYYLPHSSGCFICGEENTFGVDARFYVEDNHVKADLCIPARFCGFKGVVHGGIVSALLDECMGWSASVFGTMDTLCFTRNLNVKFRKNTPSETPLTLITSYSGKNRMFYEASGCIKDSEGTVYAEGSGQFIAVPEEKMDETMNYLRMDPSLSYHPVFIKIYEKWKSEHKTRTGAGNA